MGPERAGEAKAGGELAALRARCAELEAAVARTQSIEEALRLNESRLSSLHELAFQAFPTEQALIQFALEEAVRLTGSEIGFFHYVHAAASEIELYTWSSGSLRECTAVSDKHYPLEQAGVWADCARTGQPVVHNDYQTLPNRQGYPEGHSHVIRHLSAPVVFGGEVQAIAGVANKHDPYDDTDMRQLQLFLDGVWRILVRQRAEQALLTAREELEGRVQQRTSELSQANAELRAEIAERLRAEEARRQVEAQMLRAQKLESLGLLAGGIAHDFNNLLMAVLGNLELAREEIDDDSLALARLLDAKDAGEHAASLCRQLLAYAGRSERFTETVDLSQVARQMLDMLRLSITRKADLSLELASDLPLVSADPAQLRQVVMNLVINASEAVGDREGQIVIRTRTEWCSRERLAATYFDDHLPGGRYVVVEVSDTGCGLAEETRLRLFDPFFTTKFTGRGLGLAAVLGIVRSHHGAVVVDSQLGHGSTFRVMFPALADARPELPAEPVRPAWQGHGVVLVADDEPFVLSVTRRLLERIGFEVVTAETGWAAVEVFRQQVDRITCVVLDLLMPGLDGGQVLATLRQEGARCPVLLVSGYDETETLSRLARQEAVGFLQKPYGPDALREALRALLEPNGAPSEG